MSEGAESTSAPISESEDVRSIRHFPVTMLGGALGLCGLGLAWRLASETLGFPPVVYKLLLGFGVGYTIAVLALYAAKAVRHWDHVMEDFRHPVRGNFLSAGPLGLMLISYGFSSSFPILSGWLWVGSAVASIVLGALIMDSWIKSEHSMDKITPAVFIPTVGMLIGPVTGADLGYDLFCWLLLGAGAFSWMALLPVTLSRLFFHGFMSPPLRPSIFVLIAPPALIAIALTRMDGGYMDNVARMLTGMALFTFLFVMAGWRKHKELPFCLPWWGYTFPISALSSACFYFYDSSGQNVVAVLAVFLLAMTSLVTGLVTVKTLIAFARGQLFRAPRF